MSISSIKFQRHHEISPILHLKYPHIRRRVDKDTSSPLFNFVIVPVDSSRASRNSALLSSFQRAVPRAFYNLSSFKTPPKHCLILQNIISIITINVNVYRSIAQKNRTQM